MADNTQDRISDAVSNVIDSEKIQEWKGSAREYYSDFQDRFSNLDTQVRSFVSQRPVAAVFGAFAVGFLAARMIRMWRR